MKWNEMEWVDIFDFKFSIIFLVLVIIVLV